MKKKTSVGKNKSNKAQNQTDSGAKKLKNMTSRQKKALTKLIQKEQKSLKRVEMLKELKEHELSDHSLSLMTSISQTQTSGLRNALKEKKKPKKTNPVEESNCSGEMAVDEEDIGLALDEDEIA